MKLSTTFHYSEIALMVAKCSATTFSCFISDSLSVSSSIVIFLSLNRIKADTLLNILFYNIQYNVNN